MEEINESAQKIFIKNIGPCLATEEQNVRLLFFRSFSHSLLTTPYLFFLFKLRISFPKVSNVFNE